MSGWRPITKEDLLVALSSKELEAISASAKADEQTSDTIIDDTIAQVTDRARGYLATAVRKGHLGGLGAAGSVPERIVGSLCHIIRQEIATRVPLRSNILTDVRVGETKAAIRLLEQIAAGAFLVEDPDAVDGASAAAPKPRIEPKNLNYRREAGDGL